MAILGPAHTKMATQTLSTEGPKMVTTYELIDEITSNYEKAPAEGLKHCHKKLQRDPKNIALGVSFCPCVAFRR
jgi:hypothetical protein